MITTSVRGHLAAQDFTPEYGWSKCDPVALFDAPIQTYYKPDLQPLERMLRRWAQQCQVLILWLDCDREGEAIGDEVRTACMAGNPRLSIYRARFSTVLDAEIQRALRSLGRLNEHFVHAVQTRIELDLRVGSAFTRFQTFRLQRKFDAFATGGGQKKGVVSYGPCQFPTLGFVVERWARIQTFVPENFWFLEMKLQVGADDNGIGNNNSNNNRRTLSFSWKRGRLYDPVATTYLYESCLDAGEAVVTSITGRPKNRWRPVPLATIELQKRASRFLRLGAEQLMTAAEELYNQGLISYPRTETEKFRPEFEHRSLIEQFVNVGDYAAYANKLLHENAFQLPRAGQNDDQAHPPITPCRAVDPNTIDNQTHRNVYKLVVVHYLACCSRDAIGKESQIVVRMDTEEFTATGLMILERNWLEIYHPWENWSTGQGELPALEVGSRIRPSSLLMQAGTTSPPQPISEVELITMMDRHGIGTDATIATHITTIQDREYATKDNQMKFLPTQLGTALIEAYNSMGFQLNKPDLRRETEAECNHIAAGRKSKEEVTAVLLAKMRQCYEAATQEAHKLDEAVARHFPRLGSNDETSEVVQNNFSLCGICSNNMALKQDRIVPDNNNQRRKLVYCNTCRSGWGLPRGNCRPKFQTDNGGPPVKCPICNFQVVQILQGDGYTGNGYTICPKCFTDPPVEHGGGSANGAEFRCFSCQHPTCTLAGGTAGGDTPVFTCPFCNQGNVCLRRNTRGYVLSCNKYSQSERCAYTIWLPKECQTVTIPTGDENQDTNCIPCTQGTRRPVQKITIVWKPGSVPPHYGRESTVCLLCDTDLRRDLSITLPQPNQVTVRPTFARRDIRSAATGGATTATTAMTMNRGGGGGGGRGGRGWVAGRGGRGRITTAGQSSNNNNSNNSTNLCYKCGNPGHFANRCPNG